MPATKVANINEAVTATIKQGQDFAASATNAVADLAGKAIPQGFDALPQPKQIVDTSFGILDVLVTAQKEITYKLLAVVEPKSAN